MAAKLNTNAAVNLISFINSDVARGLFAFCLGGILGLIAWYFMYFYMVDLVFNRIDRAHGERFVERDRRNFRVDG
ncbi:hypothetical protein OCU04_006339 [Sclerotinia nivalis]|uniref:Uncharacterized protein n=1 Tax=Sclerotinia nivalis TaxID=352851 RepID=A0A9X0AMT6_9HELO|nr:hypothetical protein OCU04_006339 [Sclerotinia nivalis]